MSCLSEPLPTQKRSWGNKAWGCIHRQRRWVISPLAMMDHNNCGDQRWFNDVPNALFITLMLLEISSLGHNDVRSSMWMQSLQLPAKWKLFISLRKKKYGTKERKETFAHDGIYYTFNDFRVSFRHCVWHCSTQEYSRKPAKQPTSQHAKISVFQTRCQYN